MHELLLHLNVWEQSQTVCHISHPVECVCIFSPPPPPRLAALKFYPRCTEWQLCLGWWRPLSVSFMYRKRCESGHARQHPEPTHPHYWQTNKCRTSPWSIDHDRISACRRLTEPGIYRLMSRKHTQESTQIAHRHAHCHTETLRNEANYYKTGFWRTWNLHFK